MKKLITFILITLFQTNVNAGLKESGQSEVPTDIQTQIKNQYEKNIKNKCKKCINNTDHMVNIVFENKNQ